MATEIDGTSKGLLGAFAVFALGSGIASLIYGVLLLLRYMPVEYNYGAFNLFSTSIVLITIGGLLIITVLFGIIGALKNVSKLRLVTLVLLFILFAVLAVVGVWGMIAVKTNRLQNSIDDDIKNFVKHGELPEAIKKHADYLHRHYNCCSVYTKYSDRANDVVIPETCCIEKDCGINPNNPAQRYFENGCSSVYFDTKSKTVFCLAILALAAAGAVLIALILYGILSQRARGDYAAVSRG